MSDKERIIALQKTLNKSIRAMAKEIGLSTPQILYDIKNEKHGISKDVAGKIAAKYLNVNLVWLLTGEGEMLNTSSVSQRVENSNHVSLYGDANSYSEENINKFLEELASQRKALEKSQEQLSVAQEQINRLITLLEKRQ